MYKLKEKPEDFIVEEVIKLELDDKGQYAYFWLEKKDATTSFAVKKICSFLKCKERDVGYAGNKDRHGITTQAISIKDHPHRLKKGGLDPLKGDQLEFRFIGRGNKPISIGDLDGNVFDVTLRDCDHKPKIINRMVNYFDEQRFSETNVEVGRAIVKKNFKQACELISSDAVKEHLADREKDYVGAMKKLPLKVRLLHIHAYQSWLWNKVVSQYLQCKYGAEKVKIEQYSQGELVFVDDVPELDVPIIGFGEGPGTGEIGRLYKELMKEEGITQRDFVIKSMPELSSEGGLRSIGAEIEDLAIEEKGKKTYTVRFSLTKGSYATMAVKQMMSPPKP